MARISSRAWIFVSHATEDLRRVREVRNYLERKDASPLLFHLKALKKPDEFWPLIEREITERPFFLLCESASASNSSWVKKERRAANQAAKSSPKKTGKIRVDSAQLDLSVLDSFIASTRVFPSYAHVDRMAVQPFLASLERRGFEVLDDLTNLAFGQSVQDQMSASLRSASENGWVLIFITSRSLKSRWVRLEIQIALELRANIIPVLLEPKNRLDVPADIEELLYFDASMHPEAAQEEIADRLLTSSRSA